MPFPDLMLSPLLLRHDTIISAPVASLFFPLKGKSALIGTRPGGPGQLDIRLAVPLDSWDLERLDPEEDGDRRGLSLSPLTFLVDPRGAYRALQNDFCPGDLLCDGAGGFAVVGRNGPAEVAVDLSPQAAGATRMGFSTWQIAITDDQGKRRIVYSKLDLPSA